MKKFVIFFFMIIACSLLVAQTGFSGSDNFVQETYLFQKSNQGIDNDGPWNIILPGEDDETPYGKLEYLNYPITTDDGDEFFAFDFKGYNIPVEDDEFVDGPYALIYYVDPGPGAWDGYPEVYVLGVTDEVWDSPAEGKGPKNVPPGHEGANLQISGLCKIDQIPVQGDVNYPNGGKVWLVPTDYLASNVPGETTIVPGETTMIGWPSNLEEILFETSLITYGFVAEQE